ncbi:hypothetical protein HDU77_005300, partial [Chytriomyces hyalinus]
TSTSAKNGNIYKDYWYILSAHKSRFSTAAKFKTAPEPLILWSPWWADIPIILYASMENKQPSSVSGNAMESPVPEPNARVPVKLDAFLQAMKFVHGLSLDNRAQNSVQELCALFKNQAMCMDRSRRQLFFFKMIAVSQHLLELCPSAIDRNMLILALDIGRAQNEDHMSQWLDELETITD